jgi:PAS domain S-box-containing protein
VIDIIKYPDAGQMIYTENINAEARLKANEQQLKLIYNATTDSIFLISIEASRYKIISVNQTFLENSGTKEDQVIGRYVDEITSEPLLSTTLKKYSEAILTHKTVRWEAICKYPAVGTISAIASVTPVFNDKGDCTMLVVTLHDITERKKAEQKLIEADAKFRNIVEQSLIGVYVIEDGNFVYVNPRFAEIFGHTQEELMNLPVEKVIHPDDRVMVAEYIRIRTQGEQDTIHYDARGIKKNGGMIWIEVFCSGKLKEKSPVIMGTLLDITERKKAEESLKKSEANLQTIFDNTDTIYVLLDNNLRVISYNQRAIDFVVKELHQNAIEKNSDFLSCFPKERRLKMSGYIQKAFSGKNINYEVPYLQQDGSVHWYYVRMFPITNIEKIRFGVMIAVSGITEKKIMEEQILHQKVQAQKMSTREVLKAEERERNKIGQELHDNVNQILASIKLFLSMAKEGDAAESNELLSRSEKLLDNAIEAIRELSESQVTPLKKDNLKELIQSLVDRLEYSTSVKTKFDYDVKDKVIDDDLKLNIYRIVQEQINNILRHADASHIHILVYTEEGFLHVSVDDNGKGFDPDKRRKGIGISNMINRIESFNGELEIESSPGNGCKLTIKIPC